MRHMSFSLTTPQMLARTKTVTRRLGWANLQPGTLLQAVEKSQGLGKGGKVRKLGMIRVVSVRREQLSRLVGTVYGREEAAREGFPDLDGLGFACLFVQKMGILFEDLVTRIEFEHVEGPTP